MKLSIIISTFILSLGSFVLSAQNGKLPRWVTAAPNATTAVGQGASIEEAKQQAIAVLLSSTSFEAQEGSVKNLLESRGEACPDQMKALSTLLLKTEEVSVVNEYEGEEGCWAQCKIQNLPKAMEAVYQTAVTDGTRYLTEAKLYQQEGLLWKAAQSYCKGLEAVTPAMNRPIITETGELGESLYEGYVHLFEGIGWLFDYDSFPMEQGEPLPLEIAISSYSSTTNMAVKGVPCYVSANDRTAEYAVSDSLTSEQGAVTINIKKAPMASKFKLQACIDDGILERGLPQNFATPKMLANVRKDIKSVYVEGYCFDPSVSYYMDLDSIDQQAIGMDIEGALTQKGWKRIDEKEKADIVVKAAYSQQDQGDTRYGKYTMKKLNCALEVAVSSVRTGQVLTTMKQPELELTLRADSRPEKIHNRASMELMKRLLPTLTAQVAALNFDKKTEVYNQARELRK